MSHELIPVSGDEYRGSDLHHAAHAPSSAQRLRRFLAALRQFWWIPLITVILGAALGFITARRLVPVYVSSARMWETLKVQLPGESLYSEDMQNLMGTQIQLLQSEKIREMTLARLAANAAKKTIPLGKDGFPLPVIIRVESAPNSSILDLSAASSDPAYTQNYLQALMETFITYDRDTRNSISGMTLASITDEIAKLEEDLKNEQDDLSAYQRTNNVEIVKNEQAVAAAYLTRLQTELADLELQSKLVETAEKEEQKTGTLLTNDAVILAVMNNLEGGSAGAQADASTPDDQNKVDLLEMRRQDLIVNQKLLTNSETIQELDDQIKGAKQAQAARKSALVQNMYDRLEAYKLVTQIKINYDKDSIKEWEAKISGENAVLGQADDMQMKIAHTQSDYDRLTQLSQNIGISRSIDQESLAILEPASPSYRSAAKENQVRAMSIAGGLAVGLAFVFLLGLRDDRFTSLVEVNQTLGDSVMAMLPRMPRDMKDQALMLAPNDQRHLYAESYRSLRSALHFLTHGESRPKTILITSATPNEGKSTVSANLAKTLAMAGSKVLLVDGDLRRGHLHDLLGLKNDQGFVNLLAGECAAADVIQHNGIHNLSFISRGSSQANPGDLLLSPNLDQLLARWKADYDYVLMDSSPVFAVADSATLAPCMDGTIFLVRSHFSSARMTREALEMLAQRRARIIGVVFNMANTKSRDYKYYKYAEYYPSAKAQE